MASGASPATASPPPTPCRRPKSTAALRDEAGDGDYKAAVIRKPGGPEVLGIETVAVPKPQLGEVLIRVKAFGLNRSELFTRLGQSPSVKFPRILGIEAVGLVEAAPGNEFGK